MGKQYNHLDLALRDRIAALKREGHSNRKIGGVLGIHHTTVGRELQLNGYGTDGRTPPGSQGNYDPATAQHKAYARRKYATYQGKKIHANPRLEAFVVTNVQRHWNPDEMAGYLKEHRDHLGFYASKTTIYDWFNSIHGERYRQYLYARRKGRPRRKKRAAVAAHIPNRTPVAQRPDAAADRQETGHYEFDAIVSSKTSGSTAALAVLQERSTRLIAVRRVGSLAPGAYAGSITDMLRSQGSVQSLTTDNGLENRAWQTITAATGAHVYFTDPYSSWQKGGVEHANKMLRRYFPKGTDFAAVTQADIDAAVTLINKKPRRCLGYKSALQLAKEKGVLLGSGALRG